MIEFRRMIKNIDIRNYKSVRELSLHDCKRYASGNEWTTRLVNFVPQTSPDGYPQIRTYKYSSLSAHDDDVEVPFLCPMTASNLSQIIKLP